MARHITPTELFSIVLVGWPGVVRKSGSSSILRVRNSASEPEENAQVYHGEVRDDSEPLEIEFTVPSTYIDGHQFELQLGYEVAPRVPYYVERWQSARVP